MHDYIPENNLVVLSYEILLFYENLFLPDYYLLLIPPSNFIEDYMYIEYIFLTIIFLYMIVGLKKIDHG